MLRNAKMRFVKKIMEKAGWDKPYKLAIYLGISTTSAIHLIEKGVSIRPIHLVKLEKLWIKNGGTHDSYWKLLLEEGATDNRKKRTDSFDPAV